MKKQDKYTPKPIDTSDVQQKWAQVVDELAELSWKLTVRDFIFGICAMDN